MQPPAQRPFWNRLGFGTADAARIEPPGGDEWAPGWHVYGTTFRLRLRHRLMVLLSGNVMVHHAVKTDVAIGRSHWTSAMSVLPPARR